MCNKNLTRGLEEIIINQFRVDNYVSYQREVIFIVYVDDGIFASPSNTVTNQSITDIRPKFDI